MAASPALEASQDISRLSLEEIRAHEQPRPAPPVPASASNPGIVAFDITSRFRKAASTLAPGELVKDGFFTLFESVGALEIMDPKMDSGCLEPGESLDNDYDVSKPLLPEEVLGIIDQLLCHEMAWHVGYPLSQTVFTCAYVESILMPAPSTLDEAHFIRNPAVATPSPMHAVLRAYCLGLLKTCGQVNESIINEHYYEAHFVTNTYHRNLLDKFSIESVRHIILETSSLLQGLEDSVPTDIIRALNDRLLLRHSFLAATDAIQYRTAPDLIRAPWKESLVMVQGLQSSHALAKHVPDAFSAKLQRKLASTMPPRPIVQLSFDDAFGHIKRLFEDGVEVIDVLEYHDSQCLQTFVLTFQAKKPQALIYIRTLLQNFLFKDMEVLGHMSIRMLLDNDLAIVALPCSTLLDRANDDVEAPQDPRFIVAETMEAFRQKAAQPYLDILRTFCQNRCRVRRTLCHVIRDWENLQFEAEDVDQILQHQTDAQPIVYRAADGGASVETFALSLSSWAHLYKLRQMEWIVQLGFELEVYQTDELAGMYWYLQHLARQRLQHVERIKTFTVRSLTQQRAGGPRGLTPAAEAQFATSLNFIRLALLDAAITAEMADAMSCLHTALHRLGLLRPQPRPYSTDELRYETRMKPFAVISHPALPTFAEFTAGTRQPATSTADLLRLAERGLAGSKKALEAVGRLSEAEAFSVGSHARWLPGVKGALKSCIATGLAVSVLQKALDRAGEGGDLKLRAEVPTPDKAYHEWWLVPRILPVR
ncbi:N-alpha-acetyltransferase 35 NatC auxiliary subunit [Verticillium nonalfalfae]|uniref:N-alpha-acetyltransferase 35 NatC auxiliary subunit n=1 Tax=Verticillium nonalfalfae TaxID=1051616 RepID=A0A3M9YBS0_9PEZI|nr:N-alpha-acetyltransferase 35 NatC auxiliary subunit [Verticillium nonalfalfae]RNJ57565.1 N-alpha-acetyltransferase 35 NatC auxiliary subunit [Verticillium nonalfalfae]